MMNVSDWGALELGLLATGTVGVGKLLFHAMEAIKDYWPNLSGTTAQIVCDVLSLIIVLLAFWQLGVENEETSNIVLGALLGWFGVREVAKGEYHKVFDNTRVMSRMVAKVVRRNEQFDRQLEAVLPDEPTPPVTGRRHEAI